MMKSRTVRVVAATGATCVSLYLFFLAALVTVYRASGSLVLLDDLPFAGEWAAIIPIAALGLACLPFALLQLYSSSAYDTRMRVIWSVILCLFAWVSVPFFLWWNVRESQQKSHRAAFYGFLAVLAAVSVSAQVLGAMVKRHYEDSEGERERAMIGAAVFDSMKR
jgi:hypothetical protein